MKIIEKLSDYINEELCDAEKYIKMALQEKTERPALSETFYRLSQEEMNHMTSLHSEVEKLIANYRRDHGEPPVDMKAVYDYLHAKAIDKAKDVKTYQAMYRES